MPKLGFNSLREESFSICSFLSDYSFARTKKQEDIVDDDAVKPRLNYLILILRPHAMASRFLAGHSFRIIAVLIYLA